MEPLNWLLDQYYYNTTTQDYILYVLYPWLVLMITYWSLGGLCLLLDFTRLRASHSVRIRKCQPKRPPTAADVTDIALHVLTHCFTVYPLGILLYFPMTKARVSEDPLDMPDGPEFLLKFFLFALCTEPVFYFIHYVLHHRLFYKRIHSVHHKYQAPIGLEALYFHWIER